MHAHVKPPVQPESETTHFDVLIVGAGLSGIGAAVHLMKNSPKKTYAILEGREAIGGTWDLFRYPGIRSDSDMYTLGYAFKPWKEAKAIADGPSIRKYVNETADEYGVRQHIRFNTHVKRSSWSTEDACWTVEAERGGQTVRYTANFVFMCSGYYNYAEGYTPDFPGQSAFKGKIVHPQHWPEDLDYSGKSVVVIGSGATAVTLVPEMAKTAKHVTMLQRSPTYVVSRPAADAAADWLRAKLPPKLAYDLVRFKNVSLGMLFFNMARKNPEKTKERLLGMVREQLGEEAVAEHFTPRYNPWDQRLCLVPDADLFESLKTGSSSVVTDTIETFTKDGIKLASGKTLKADIIVTATGLNMQLLSGMEVTVDGKAVSFPDTLSYKGMMFSGVPNLASSFGYTNASWTLKCDLTCEYVCRLINHMDKKGLRQATPVATKDIPLEPWLDFSSGYVQRGIGQFPRQGAEKPWKANQNYAKDLMALRFGAVEDGAMVFSNPKPKKASRPVGEPVAA